MACLALATKTGCGPNKRPWSAINRTRHRQVRHTQIADRAIRSGRDEDTFGVDGVSCGWALKLDGSEGDAGPGWGAGGDGVKIRRRFW